MRISYELRDEQRQIDDPDTESKIKSNAEAKQRIQEKSQECTTKKAAVEREHWHECRRSGCRVSAHRDAYIRRRGKTTHSHRTDSYRLDKRVPHNLSF